MNWKKNFHGIKNYHITNKEVGNKIIFLRKLARGGSTHSFGIHVAKMAGMPPSLIERANDILKQLETKHVDEARSQESEVRSQKALVKKLKIFPANKCNFPFLMHTVKHLMK